MSAKVQKNLEQIARKFCEGIPTDPTENVRWRLELYSRLAAKVDERNDFLSMCAVYYPIVFKSMFWTFNPKLKSGQRNRPFITWQKQDEAIDAIVNAIANNRHLVIDKSREEGATWLLVGTFVCFMLFEDDCNFLVGSRKEEYVDKTGDHKTLFAKADYLLDKLPIWFKPEVERNHRHLKILRTNSVLDGEATNENFGAGDRRTAVALDEFGRVDANIAESIKDTITDVSDCVIYNSTHFYGRTHPYAKALYSEHVKVMTLGWETNPIKALGLYSSPDLDIIEIHDIKYWQRIMPLVFNDFHENEKYKSSKIEWDSVQVGYKPYQFIADGNGAQLRSPWFDKQERERSEKDLAMNVKRDPLGSSGAFFDIAVIHRAIHDSKEPDYKGEINFKIEDDKVKNIGFRDNFGRRRLKWWGNLKDGMPDQSHNYIIGCDISMGTGSSHSAATIYDVNTNTKCGSWCCSMTEPRGFAEQVCALCLWTCGMNTPFLIWESNGGQGLIFERRITELSYTNIYYQSDERIAHRPESYKKGWHSSKSSKQDLLTLYRTALHCRYSEARDKAKFINYDKESLRQCEDYVYLDASGGIGPSKFRESDDGAKATHGDMVIADALCCLAVERQPVAIKEEKQEIHKNSMAYRDYITAIKRLESASAHWAN